MTKEENFIELISGLTIKLDESRFPDSLFWFKGDKYFFDLNLTNCGLSPKQALIFFRLHPDEYLNCKNGYFWCNYEKVWSIFESKYGMEFNDIQNFIKDMVEEHFKLRSLTTGGVSANSELRAEEHFKLRSLTPVALSQLSRAVVEEHFKLRSLTTKSTFNRWCCLAEEHLLI